MSHIPESEAPADPFGLPPGGGLRRVSKELGCPPVQATQRRELVGGFPEKGLRMAGAFQADLWLLTGQSGHCRP